MSAREWVAPVLVGLLAAFGIYWIAELGDPEQDPDMHPEDTGPDWSKFTWVFPEGPTSLRSQMLVIAPLGDIDSSRVRVADSTMAQFTDAHPYIGIVDVRPLLVQPPGQTFPQDVHWLPHEPRDSARLFEGGLETAAVTAYVFDDGGGLLASNVNDTRFGLPSFDLPSEPWYLGNQTTPPGAITLDGAAADLLEDHLWRLNKQPVGGIASAYIEDHPYAAWIGPVYVTLRIDGLS